MVMINRKLELKKVFIIISLLLICYFSYSAGNNDQSNDNKDQELDFKKDQMKHESENPVFLHKGGMLRVGEHSFYLRTMDEWTGFSTVYLGYRYGVSKAFNIAIEGAASPIPHVYMANILLHFKLYESPKKFFFLGMRMTFGYKYQDSDFNAWTAFGGRDYLYLKRNGFYFIPDLTVAFRFGKFRQYCLYYTIYPRFDFDLVDKVNPIYILFSPVMAGYEVRFPSSRYDWTFAVEAGYTFPMPWNSIQKGKWVNFPSLANISFNYKFGDKFYSKKNLEKYKKK